MLLGGGDGVGCGPGAGGQAGCLGAKAAAALERSAEQPGAP